MKNKWIKKICAAVLCFSLFSAGSIQFDRPLAVSASTPLKVEGTTLKSYPYTDNNFPIYESTGTNKKKIGTCFGRSDEIIINGIGWDGWADITIPVSGGTKRGYCEIKYLLCDTDWSPASVSAGKKITTYKKQNCTASYGYIGSGDTIYIIGHSSGNTQVLYPAANNTWKLAWIRGNYSIKNGSLSSGTNSTAGASWDSRIGSTPANINSLYYTSGNISYPKYKGQCTWYAYGRFYEACGIKLKTARHAKYWLKDNSGNSKVSVLYGASNIREKSIAVRTTGTYGHVMFIEHVTYSGGTPQYVYFTECNTDGNGRYDAGKDCILKRLSYSSFLSQKNPAGYIIAR